MLLRNVSILSVPASSFLTKSLTPSSRGSIKSISRLYSASTSRNNNKKDNNIQVPSWVPDFDDDDGGYSRPVIQWYPGHIAKAERVLRETFQAVDVVVEVRDARASKATSHPRVPEWVSGKPRLVVFTHVDLVPSATHRAWKTFFQESQEVALENNADNNNNKLQYLWVNAKQGQGIPALHRAIFKAGAHVQERRQRRGLKDRPLRVGCLGYPNVGKSALINRLLGRRRARTANTPGITRSLQWIRVRTDDSKKTNKKEYELLDSPGIIPASLDDQSDALLLAACNCIGDASYDNQVVAAYLCQWMQNVMIQGRAETAAPDWRDNCRKRWGVDPLAPVPMDSQDPDKGSRYVTGEEMIYMVADNKCKGSPEDASRKVLQDFRNGRMGSVCLQVAPDESVTENSPSGPIQDFSQVPDPRMGTVRVDNLGSNTSYEQFREQQEAQKRERAMAARETAKERGLELPPSLEEPDEEKSTGSSQGDVGKGLFDGW
ncbi:DAR GTPase 3, chloroplastic [Seminavis robusta]|uniref:DAR GTPase 3, chloroplastic n=1 Tax=Seminavis robusta TaxID=568900 RepID=A0A9N8H6R3_9STRA|nr:DAR GTPase 3, chloroplastic [Seminavis robusta]|eukprot:Sro155_g070500.1 DAR GTPase 3, chloroplastic (490) ;mRNA; f:87876-89537